MKTIKSILFCLSILFVFSSTTAQTYKKTDSDGDNEILRDKDTKLNYLSSQEATNASHLSASASSSVFIQQVGSDNIFTSNTSSEKSNLNIVQQGDENLVHLDLTAKDIEKTILQNGTRNSFFNIANNPLSNQKTQVLQDGTNQDITLYGENSFSENMQIMMEGSDRSIIIRNFN